MTEFIITQLPSARTLMKVDGVAAVVNTPYDIALQNTIELINQTIFRGEPFDQFKYKIRVDGTESTNEGTVTVNYPVNSTTPQAPVNIIHDMVLNSSVFFGTLVSNDESFDRIIVESIAGLGQWTLNGADLYVGQEIFAYQMASILFASNDPGGGDEYAKMEFRFADKNGSFAGLSSITARILTLAKLVLTETPLQTEDNDTNVRTINFAFRIENALSNKSFLIHADCSQFGYNGSTPNTKLFLSWSGSTFTITAEAPVPVTGTTGDDGIVEFDAFISTEIPYTWPTGEVEFTLIEIDGDISNTDAIINTFTIPIPTV